MDRSNPSSFLNHSAEENTRNSVSWNKNRTNTRNSVRRISRTKTCSQFLFAGAGFFILIFSCNFVLELTLP
jgi:hypothetical protein